MNFINPKTDFAFKKIFASQGSEPILISFLNALIYEGESVISSLEILNPDLNSAVKGRKETYLDIKAKLKDGSLVLIEMQMVNVKAFGKRIVYNAAKSYTLQLARGKSYWTLKPVISLTLTDFILFPDYEEIISSFSFREDRFGFPYRDETMRLVFVELPKFRKELEEVESLLDRWLYFMKAAPLLDEIPEPMAAVSEVRQAFEIANRANLSVEELEELEGEELFFADQEGAVRLALQEGRKQEKFAIARQLLDFMGTEEIARVTGLHLEAIEGLRHG